MLLQQDAHLSMVSSLSTSVSYAGLKKFFQAIFVSLDAQATKLGVEPHVSAEQDTPESMESAESSTVEPINLLTALNVSASQGSKGSTQSAETSPVLQMKYSTERIASVFKAIKESTISVKSFNAQPIHSGMDRNAHATKDL